MAATARSYTPSWLDGAVVHLAVAVQVHVPGEERVGLVLVHLLLEQQRVRAEIDELLALQDLGDDLGHLLVQQRLAAGDGDHGGAALVHGLQGVGHGQALVQDLGRVVDLAAAGAGQVAAEQRLQHQHERVALAPRQMLLDDVVPTRITCRNGTDI